jgi:hypothetical protein
LRSAQIEASRATAFIFIIGNWIEIHIAITLDANIRVRALDAPDDAAAGLEMG